jgi:serine/threonine protein kinase
MAGETLLNGRYQLLAQQGSGGMAVIYKAQDQALGRVVAVKILRPSLTNDPAFLTRFRNEARAVANLSHPNIVTVHDVGNDGPTHYIVMEFVEGQDLKKIIREKGALPVERALNLSIQICAGVGFAHRAGLVHADVKPQNILVTNDDIVKVTDFGIAQALGDTQPGVVPGERQAVVWGSPHYFAPEQARGEKPTPASDVYAIGVLMFEMLTGRLPYTGTNQQELALAHIRDRVPLVSEFNPAVPESLTQIVYKVMSKEPAARYRMADQLGRILISYRDKGKEQTIPGGQQPVTVEPPPPPPPAVTSQSARANLPPLQQSTVQKPPPPYSTAEPTQKYDIAPSAPQAADVPSPYKRATSPPPLSPSPTEPQQYPYQQPLNAQPPRSDSGRFYTQPPYAHEEDEPQGLDVVTIALAVLAFFAVACLIPLYIAVIQARFG